MDSLIAFTAEIGAADEIDQPLIALLAAASNTMEGSLASA